MRALDPDTRQAITDEMRAASMWSDTPAAYPLPSCPWSESVVLGAILADEIREAMPPTAHFTAPHHAYIAPILSAARDTGTEWHKWPRLIAARSLDDFKGSEAVVDCLRRLLKMPVCYPEQYREAVEDMRQTYIRRRLIVGIEKLSSGLRADTVTASEALSKMKEWSEWQPEKKQHQKQPRPGPNQPKRNQSSEPAEQPSVEI